MKIEEAILKLVCKEFNVESSKVQSKYKGSPEVADARQAAFLLIRKHTDLRLKHISQFMKRKNEHTGAIYNINAAVDHCHINKVYNARVSKIDDICKRYIQFNYERFNKDYSKYKIKNGKTIKKTKSRTTNR